MWGPSCFGPLVQYTNGGYAPVAYLNASIRDFWIATTMLRVELQKTEPTIHIKTFSVYDALYSLMFTIYKTRINFYLWYIAKNMSNIGMLNQFIIM